MSLKLILFIIFFNYPVFAWQTHFEKPFTIMLNPAGDAKDSGRRLNESFERGITLQFCQALKKEIEETYKNVRIVLTRLSGETVEPLQNANFSNRLEADFFFSIHFYKEHQIVPQVYLFNYINKPFFCLPKIEDLYFYRFDDAYLINLDKTIKYANKIQNSFGKNEYKKIFNFRRLFSIPFKPLIGIVAPSIAIEIGLKRDEWVNYVNTILESIGEIINL